MLGLLQGKVGPRPPLHLIPCVHTLCSLGLKNSLDFLFLFENPNLKKPAFLNKPKFNFILLHEEWPQRKKEQTLAMIFFHVCCWNVEMWCKALFDETVIVWGCSHETSKPMHSACLQRMHIVFTSVRAICGFRECNWFITGGMPKHPNLFSQHFISCAVDVIHTVMSHKFYIWNVNFMFFSIMCFFWKSGSFFCILQNCNIAYLQFRRFVQIVLIFPFSV